MTSNWSSEQWLPLERELFDSLTSSKSTQIVPRTGWPQHVPKMEGKGNQVVQVWSWVPREGEGVIEVIRQASTYWKRDRWYLIKTTDGRTRISRTPDKSIEGDPHHADKLPGWSLDRP